MSNQLQVSRTTTPRGTWSGPVEKVKSSSLEIYDLLQDLDSEIYLIEHQGKLAAAQGGSFQTGSESGKSQAVYGVLPAFQAEQFGDPGFLAWHKVKSPYMAGSMANGISGEKLVAAMGKSGYLASFGAGGLPPGKIEAAVQRLQQELPAGPYAFNLIHSPNEPELEQKAVDIYLEHQVRTIEASAFLRLTPTLVEYRAAGLEPGENGSPRIHNKIIGKLSRREVARQFLSPAPEKMLRSLVNAGKITSQQADLAARVPMADDITVEADSGGHTDNRPLTSLLPSLLALRNELQKEHLYPTAVRIGAGGGIGTPLSVMGAFSMGADYIVTGSINQGCREAATSNRVKTLLSEAEATDVIMAPSADMFEMGVNVQVLKRGTMFPMRAQKLFKIYQTYDGIESIPASIRLDLEQKIFQNNLEDIWEECIQFFSQRDPSQLDRARSNPKRKMALIFRWYLGLATHWGIHGEESRKLDYQIWCGPAMGAFNDWFRGSPLSAPENRSAPEVADRMMHGAAFLQRLYNLQLQGFNIPAVWKSASSPSPVPIS